MQLVASVPLNTPPEIRALAEDVLKTVATCRFASVGSLMAYGGPNGLTLEMLDAWCRAGLLYRGTVQPDPLRPLQIEYVALTPHGAKALYAATGRHVEGVSTARLKRSSQKRHHDLMTGEVALAVTSLAKDGLVDLAGVEVDDHQLANVVHIVEVGREPERVVLQPDALIVTKDRAGPAALLVEVDRGTIAPKKDAGSLSRLPPLAEGARAGAGLRHRCAERRYVGSNEGSTPQPACSSAPSQRRQALGIPGVWPARRLHGRHSRSLA
jgi:hypothetical protein